MYVQEKVPYSGPSSQPSSTTLHLKGPLYGTFSCTYTTRLGNKKVVRFGGGSSEHGLLISCLNCASQKAMCHVTTKETFVNVNNKNCWLWHDICGTANILSIWQDVI